MEIRNLSTFIKVAEEQSLSKAAKQLGYAQSTVTMQMQQLEQELGIPLYERVGRQIRITQQGQELFQYAVRIVKTSQEALQIGKEKRQAVGILRLGIGNMMGEEQTAVLLRRYTGIHPEARVNVRIADSRTLTGLLVHNEIDLMMTVDHRLPDPMLVHAIDREEAVHFVAAPDHPLAKKRKPGLKEIFEFDPIRGDPEDAGERDLENALEAEGLSGAGRMEMSSRSLALTLALHGGAVTLAPDGAVEEDVRQGRLVRLDYELPGAGLWRQTIYHKNKWLTGAMDAWIKMLEDT